MNGKHKIINKNNKRYIFDIIRKKYVILTPEEWVRQNLLLFLIEEKSYPKSLIRVEQKLEGKNMFFRSDAIVYDNKGNARMIIECKADNIKITQDVFEQISKYNLYFKVEYLLVSNGKENYICKLNYTDKSYVFLDEIPEYSELIKWLICVLIISKVKVNGKHYETVWMENGKILMIDQNALPFDFKIVKLNNYKETCNAIKTMIVRGAGAIGVTAGFAMVQAALEANKNNYEEYIAQAKSDIESTRPTARNLFTATEIVYKAALSGVEQAIKAANKFALEDKKNCKKIGELGNTLIKDGYKIETHCNAGWIAFTDYGSALAPIYEAHASGKNIFVYVDETRPRSQGAKLTAWELNNENVPNVIIPDNAGAHLMSKGLIDMIIVGADRIAANGDIANKIGTLEKAIAAKYYNIPFYVAAPLSTFDFECKSGKDIIIEERSQDEVLFQKGINSDGKIETIQVSAPYSKAINPAFDVTPAELISGIITERGIFKSGELRTAKPSP